MIKKQIQIFLIASFSVFPVLQNANAKLCLSRCHEMRDDCFYVAKKDKTKIQQCRTKESSCVDWCSKCMRDALSTLTACIEKADTENTSDVACYDDYDKSFAICDNGPK